MAGLKRKKKYVALLSLLLLGGFTYLTTGARGDDSEAEVDSRPPSTVNFNGDVDGPIQVTCAPNATTGTGEVELRVTGAGNEFDEGDIIPDVLVTWAGGSTTINRYDTPFVVSGATLPCPPAGPAGQQEPFTFHFPNEDEVDNAKLILNIQISINLGLNLGNLIG